jgi:long-chain acyl-CoA synthetase
MIQGIEISKALTIPKLFLEQAGKFGKDSIAMREKEFGIWRPITWHDYLENVKYLALGLISIGLKDQDKISMIGTNRPEGLWAEMATMCARGIGVWLFQECLIEEVKYIVDHSDTRFIFCESQEEVDKALSIFDECQKLEKIIWDDPKGMRYYKQDYLISFKEVQRLGKELDQKQPHLFEEIIFKGHGDETALLFYTSGTTALPKGVLLSHYNMLTMGKNLMAVDPCFETDDYVSYLPFAWIGEQMMSISCGLQIGFTLNFPESSETSQANIREIGPHVMFPPPRMYEQMTRTVQVKYLDSTWIKRKCYELAAKIGYHVADLKFNKKAVPLHWKILELVAYIGVQKKLKDHLGLSWVRNAYTGGAAMGPDHFRFFHAMGVNLKQIYGQTEVAGISVIHRSGDIKFDTVGVPIPETEVKITENGEIITKSPSICQPFQYTFGVILTSKWMAFYVP